MIPEAWSDLPFFTEDWPRIERLLANETLPVLPPDKVRFAALSLLPPAHVRAVILGQDPYPTPGHAMGLAFSVAPDVRPLPRSLTNIFKELQSDLQIERSNGDLTGWARQGVLLLNTSLSVPAGHAGGHSRLGWQTLAQQVLARVSQKATAFVLWGGHAQSLRPWIDRGDHLLIETAHPSPLSARRGFFGSRPFSQINNWLTRRGDSPIDWAD